MKLKPNPQWLLSLILVVGAIFMMQYQGRVLQTAETPTGIIALELVHQPQALQSMLAQWDLETVRLNIWLDFLLIPAYSFFFLSSIRVLISKHNWPVLQKLGDKLIFLAYLAAGLDVIENGLMLLATNGVYSSGSLWTTALVAGSKFTCIAIILIYLILSLPVLVISAKKDK